jgi:hypothetical protein
LSASIGFSMNGGCLRENDAIGARQKATQPDIQRFQGSTITGGFQNIRINRIN